MPRKSGKGWLVCLLLALTLGVLAMPASGQSPVPTVKPFVMGADAAPDSLAFYWAKLIYTEAFRRLGMPVEVMTYTLTRRSILVEEGVIDGEVSRIYGYADAHPELLRIEEPVMDFTFSLFTANPTITAKSLAELPANAIVEYRRGILLCENKLKEVIPAERMSNVLQSVQGLKKLLAGRTDAYCDIASYVKEALNGPELKGTTGVRKLFDVASLPTYPYLFKKHADLAPRLTAVLKQMREEGLLAEYPKQAEREMGWSR